MLCLKSIKEEAEKISESNKECLYISDFHQKREKSHIFPEKIQKNEGYFWRTGFPSFWIYSLSATEEDWGDRREEQMSVFWILFFFQNSENKQTQMQIFFLEFRKK